MLRGYQLDLKNDVYKEWANGATNVCAVLPTGGGKTITFADIIKDHVSQTECMAIAHRQELVSQISLALAREEIKHRLIAPKNVIKLCVSLHMQEIGRSWFDLSARCYVAGVDTLIRRTGDYSNIGLWVMDEAHHVLKDNKWGKAVAMFPNARGLGVTATPWRTDGNGLGRQYDGVMDSLVVGPNMRDLISMEFLTDYRIFAPETDIDLIDVNVSPRTGDYNADKLRAAVRKSKIVGDIVSHYMRIAPGKLGVTFLPDVETATITAEQFRAANIPAEVVHAKTPDRDRIKILRRFRNRELLQLVNVDLFGEGFDLPAIEVVSMGRPTQSYGLYVQQFGRGLRILDGKDRAIIIDHVGNVMRHGLPDVPKVWSLERREKRSSPAADDVIPVTTCMSCTAVYERIHRVCPYCGYQHIPSARTSPEFVDGDLTELDAATLAAMRGEIARVDMTADEYRAELINKGAKPEWAGAHVKRHTARQEAQAELRNAIAWWAGYQRALGREDSESYKRFYYKFKIDVLTAQTLGAIEASELTARVRNDMVNGGIK